MKRCLFILAVCGLCHVSWAADEATLNLGLPANLAEKIECARRGSPEIALWLEIKDERTSTELGYLIQKGEEIPLLPQISPAALILDGLRMGFQHCSYTLAESPSQAQVVIFGKLTQLEGSSTKGLIKGKAEAKLNFTLHLEKGTTKESFFETWSLEEEVAKGIGKKPKKLERILNNLLTRLVITVFESHRLADWLLE